MATIYSYKQNTDTLDNRLTSSGFTPDSVGLPGNANVVFVSPLSVDDKTALDQTMFDAGFNFDSEITGSSSAEFVLLTGNATTPGLSPIGSAWLWYDSTLNALRVSLSGGAAVSLLTAGGGTTDLQGAYDLGSTINLSAANPVTLNKTVADASSALVVNVSDGTGTGVEVSLSGSATGPAAIFTGGSVGFGTTTPSSRVHVFGSLAMKVRSVSTNSVAGDEAVIAVDASGGAVTITLPSAITAVDRTYYVKKVDSSLNAVFVQASGIQTIDGQNIQHLSVQYEGMQIVSDGTGWLKI